MLLWQGLGQCAEWLHQRCQMHGAASLGSLCAGFGCACPHACLPVQSVMGPPARRLLRYACELPGNHMCL
jgi:hypothetical protein